MALRHAAALALVGWYLMGPPHVFKGDCTAGPCEAIGVDVHASMRYWDPFPERFKTA